MTYFFSFSLVSSFIFKRWQLIVSAFSHTQQNVQPHNITHNLCPVWIGSIILILGFQKYWVECCVCDGDDDDSAANRSRNNSAEWTFAQLVVAWVHIFHLCFVLMLDFFFPFVAQEEMQKWVHLKLHRKALWNEKKMPFEELKFICDFSLDHFPNYLFIYFLTEMIYKTLFSYSFTSSPLDMLIATSLNMYFMRWRCILLDTLKYAQLAQNTVRNAGRLISHHKIHFCLPACFLLFIYSNYGNEIKRGQLQCRARKSFGDLITPNPNLIAKQEGNGYHFCSGVYSGGLISPVTYLKASHRLGSLWHYLTCCVGIYLSETTSTKCLASALTSGLIRKLFYRLNWCTTYAIP